MKTIFFFFTLIALVLGLVGCASAPYSPPPDDPRYLPPSPGEQVLGQVEVTVPLFTSQNGPPSALGHNAAIQNLIREANRQFESRALVLRDVNLTLITRRSSTVGDFLASATVVSLSGLPSTGSSTQSSSVATARGIEGSLERATENAMRNVPERSRIAIVNVAAPDRSLADFIAGDLEIHILGLGYRVIDRTELDRIRAEQQFQLAGEVDDATAVSIGRLAGAEYILTARIDGEGTLRRLRLRVLETQTAELIGVSAESY